MTQTDIIYGVVVINTDYFHNSAIDYNLIKLLSDSQFTKIDMVFEATGTQDPSVYRKIGFDLGYIAIYRRNVQILCLFSRAGNQSLKHFLITFIENLAEEKAINILGFLVFVNSVHMDTAHGELAHFFPNDTTTPTWSSMKNARRELQVLKELAPDAPYIVAAFNCDQPEALSTDELRKEIELDDRIPIVPYKRDDKESAKQVLLMLLDKLRHDRDKRLSFFAQMKRDWKILAISSVIKKK